MSNTTSDAPLNAPSQDIVLERSIYYGVIFMSICYGVCMYMFFHSLTLYFGFQKDLRQQYRLYMIIGTSSVFFDTIAVFANVVLMQFMWIDHRDFEGGPLGYFLAHSSAWWQVLGTATAMVANFIGDGLLIYRCYIIWHGSWLIITFPILLYLGSVAMALVTLVQSARPGDFFTGIAVNFGVPWAVLSVTLNVFVTTIIIVRLMGARRRLKGIMPRDALSVYTGISAVLVESCLPFSVLGIIFAVTYGKSLPIGPAFMFIWGVFVTLAPQFIIFRVMNGKSWTTDIVTQATAGNWNTNTNTNTTQSRNQPISFRTDFNQASNTKLNSSMTPSGVEVEMHTVTEDYKRDPMV
ncbi:hypothetical protein BU17DRAFT_88625 [Hysterangium stoloniferum]|nr:hypothetical protein BU17DRAFT_88625 [Hysterangium stoloniferum]